MISVLMPLKKWLVSVFLCYHVASVTSLSMPLLVGVHELDCHCAVFDVSLAMRLRRRWC